MTGACSTTPTRAEGHWSSATTAPTPASTTAARNSTATTPTKTLPGVTPYRSAVAQRQIQPYGRCSMLGRLPLKQKPLQLCPGSGRRPPKMWFRSPPRTSRPPAYISAAPAPSRPVRLQRQSGERNGYFNGTARELRTVPPLSSAKASPMTSAESEPLSQGIG